mmetsp:Transcript_51185/g.155658  ORF Transcript_51185/g.155658 Transcript_51185/m.155658 type:complete len:247 (+) Transcript_51185:623-1363(+)
MQHSLVHGGGPTMRDEGPHIWVRQDRGLRHPSLGAHACLRQGFDAALEKLWRGCDEEPPRPVCHRFQQSLGDASGSRPAPEHGAEAHIDDRQALGIAPRPQTALREFVLLRSCHFEAGGQHGADVVGALRDLAALQEVWQKRVDDGVRHRRPVIADWPVLWLDPQVVWQECHFVLRMPEIDLRRLQTHGWDAVVLAVLANPSVDVDSIEDAQRHVLLEHALLHPDESVAGSLHILHGLFRAPELRN